MAPMSSYCSIALERSPLARILTDLTLPLYQANDTWLDCARKEAMFMRVLDSIQIQMEQEQDDDLFTENYITKNILIYHAIENLREAGFYLVVARSAHDMDQVRKFRILQNTIKVASAALHQDLSPQLNEYMKRSKILRVAEDRLQWRTVEEKGPAIWELLVGSAFTPCLARQTFLGVDLSNGQTEDPTTEPGQGQDPSARIWIDERARDGRTEGDATCLAVRSTDKEMPMKETTGRGKARSLSVSAHSPVLPSHRE